MYASIRTYRLEAGDLEETAHRVDQHLAEQLSREPGFVDYQLIRTGEDTVCSVTVFSDETGAERSNEIADEFVGEHLGDMRIVRTDMQSGELMVSRAAREVLEPAHR